MADDDRLTGEAAMRELALDLLRDLPCGIAVSDPDGNLSYVNQTLADWLGHGVTDLGGRPQLSSLLTVPGRIFLQTHVMPMLRIQGFAREIACQLLRDGGPPLQVLLNAVLRKDAHGQPVRIDYSIFDASERSIYESQLRRARQEAEELAAIVRSSPNAILRVAGDGSVQAWNAGAEAHFGVGGAEALGRPVEELVALPATPHWFTTRSGAEETAFEARHGNGCEYEVTIAPIDRAAKDGPDYSVIFRDVTDRKNAERHLRLMVREMDHRVKNTLTVVNAIARQTLSSEQNKPFLERLLALTRAHDALTEAHWDVVDLRLLLEMIQAEAGGADRFSFSGPPVTLQPRQMTSLSMIFHELTTNALKYGSLSDGQGRIDTRHFFEGGDRPNRLIFEWVETGGPPVARVPGKSGFGSRMIRLLVQSEFAGAVETEYDAAGLRYRLTLNFPDAAN